MFSRHGIICAFYWHKCNHRGHGSYGAVTPILLSEPAVGISDDGICWTFYIWKCHSCTSPGLLLISILAWQGPCSQVFFACCRFPLMGSFCLWTPTNMAEIFWEQHQGLRLFPAILPSFSLLSLVFDLCHGLMFSLPTPAPFSFILWVSSYPNLLYF